MYKGLFGYWVLLNELNATEYLQSRIQTTSKTLPRSLFGEDRSSFALIDPSTELYHRKLDRHGWLTLRQHIAISYVWAEWKDDPSDRLPNWSLIRQRLLHILGPHAPNGIGLETGNATCCWLDFKCVDQDSVSSKSYWISRMDQIYAEAKCTVLLLRDLALLPLVPVVRSMMCKIKSKTSVVDWPHSCVLSQSCTIFSPSSRDQENVCIQALKRLFNGAWRKRAWIFQEILLSKKYILSIQGVNCIELGEIGVLANLLLQRHPDEDWLGHFADW